MAAKVEMHLKVTVKPFFSLAFQKKEIGLEPLSGFSCYQGFRYRDDPSLPVLLTTFIGQEVIVICNRNTDKNKNLTGIQLFLSVIWILLMSMLLLERTPHFLSCETLSAGQEVRINLYKGAPDSSKNLTEVLSLSHSVQN